MESMGYVTAGILDSVVHPDAAVESAIVKVRELSIDFVGINDGVMVTGNETHLIQCLTSFQELLMQYYCYFF